MLRAGDWFLLGLIVFFADLSPPSLAPSHPRAPNPSKQQSSGTHAIVIGSLPNPLPFSSHDHAGLVPLRWQCLCPIAAAATAAAAAGYEA